MQRLDLKRGQMLNVTELAGGGLQLLPYDPDFEKTIEIADEVMDEYRDTLRARPGQMSRRRTSPSGSHTTRPSRSTVVSCVASAERPDCATRACCSRRLERPVNKRRYERAGLPALAAAYAFGLAKNHAFVDGNKRIAFMAMMVFLRKNGIRFAPDQAQATKVILALAAGEVSEQSLARWITDNLPKS